MKSSQIRQDTKTWKAQVWFSFGAAITVCASGLARLPGADLDHAFMVMGYIFCLCSVFALAKTLRDAHEADLRETPQPQPAQQP